MFASASIVLLLTLLAHFTALQRVFAQYCCSWRHWPAEILEKIMQLTAAYDVKGWLFRRATRPLLFGRPANSRSSQVNHLAIWLLLSLMRQKAHSVGAGLKKACVWDLLSAEISNVSGSKGDGCWRPIFAVALLEWLWPYSTPRVTHCGIRQYWTCVFTNKAVDVCLEVGMLTIARCSLLLWEYRTR